MGGRLRGSVTVEGRLPRSGSLFSEDGETGVFLDASGKFDFELPPGRYEFFFDAHRAIAKPVVVDVVEGRTTTLAHVDLMNEERLDRVREGDPCPMHPTQRLRRAIVPVVYGLLGLDRHWRHDYPFGQDFVGGGCCVPGSDRTAEVLRCDACLVEYLVRRKD